MNSIRSVSRPLALLALICLPVTVSAQELPGIVIQPPPVTGAWFISAGGGIGGHDNGPFSRRLQSYTPRTPNGERVLYQTEEITNVGASLNGALAFQISDALLLGASGELLTFPIVRSVRAPGEPQDEYSLGGWGAGLDVGMLLIRQPDMLLSPFLHAGYYGYSLDYVNNQEHDVPFFEGEPIPAGETATFTGAAPRIGVGVSLVSSFGAGLGDGVTPLFNVRLIYGRMLARPEWEQDGEVVTNGGLTPAYNALTLTFQIGLGGAQLAGPDIR